jgi:peptide/nickel transport system permease protein
MGGEPDTFESVDWSETGSRLSTLSRRDRGAIVAGLALVAAFVYDYAVLPASRPTVTVPVEWNVTQLDWLFVTTLLALLFYVVVPLYANRRLTAYYWREFRKNRMAVLGLGYLLVVFLIGVVGPLVLDKPDLAVRQAYQPPAFVGVDASVPVNCLGPVVDGQCRGTMAHPLGTTGDGKDVLVLVVYGMQVSMKVGLISTLLVVTIGTTVGTVAAYGGGLVDEALMRYVDVQLVFPAFFLYLLLTYLFGGSLFMFIVIFGLTGWGSIARLVRSEALQRAEEAYVTAARGAGAGTFYVIRRHLVPNVSNSVAADPRVHPLRGVAVLPLARGSDRPLVGAGDRDGPERPLDGVVDLDGPRRVPLYDHPRVQLPGRRAAGRARPATGGVTGCPNRSSRSATCEPSSTPTREPSTPSTG